MDEIHNPDIRRIREIPYLRESLEALERRRDWARGRCERITRQFSPVSGGGGGARRPMDDMAAELEELDRRYQLLMKSYLRQLRHAERLLAGIESLQLRTFITLAYLEDRKGPDIQKRMNMSRWVYENSRRICEEADSIGEIKWHDRR